MEVIVLKTLSILSLLLLWLVVFYFLHQPSRHLQVIVCDVGQGDAILVQHSSWQLLVDGGKDTSVLQCLEENMPFGDQEIDVVIATHPDSDHIGGLPAVIERYMVDLVLTNGQVKNSDDFRQLEEVVQRKTLFGTQHKQADSGMSITVPKTHTFFEVKVISPLVENDLVSAIGGRLSETILSDATHQKNSRSTSYNDGSIVLLLRYGKIDVLLTGDLEAPGEQALLESGLIRDIEVLKVGHHGAKTSSTREFIEKLRPEISLISVGKDNSYGHPSPQVIENLRQISSLILRTDHEGTIKLNTDGKKIWRSSSPKNVKELIVWLSFHHDVILFNN